MDSFHAVSRREPCPICRHADWCIVSNDGCVCICRRTESPRPARSGIGWIHRLREGGARGASALPRTVGSAPRADRIDIAAYFAALPQGDVQDRMCKALETKLGLPAAILRTLDWRWDRKAHAIAIPMRDAWGQVTGIRYRAFGSGQKWARRGSKDGLFFDPEFVPYDADTLLVCEGPTDAAAAMACGFWVVGRSSCGTGRDLIRDFVNRHDVKRLVIIADDDKPRPRPGGGTWRPGFDGAKRLGEQLGKPYGIALPPLGCKDLRDWFRKGTLNEVTLQQAIGGVHQTIAADPRQTAELVALCEGTAFQ